MALKNLTAQIYAIGQTPVSRTGKIVSLILVSLVVLTFFIGGIFFNLDLDYLHYLLGRLVFPLIALELIIRNRKKSANKSSTGYQIKSAKARDISSSFYFIGFLTFIAIWAWLFTTFIDFFETSGNEIYFLLLMISLILFPIFLFAPYLLKRLSNTRSPNRIGKRVS